MCLSCSPFDRRVIWWYVFFANNLPYTLLKLHSEKCLHWWFCDNMCAYTFICCCFILIINPSTCIIPNYFMLLLAVYSYVRTDPPPILHAAPHTTHPSPGRWGAEARAAGGWCPPQQDPEGTQQAVDGWWQPKVSEADVAITYLGKHFVCPYPLKWNDFR